MNAAAGKHVFLTIHGKVITVLAGDQLSGNRCVIAVTGNQRWRPRSLQYAGIRFRRTHVLRIDLPDNMQHRTTKVQCLGDVFTNPLQALLLVVVEVNDDLLTRQVFRE